MRPMPPQVDPDCLPLRCTLPVVLLERQLQVKGFLIHLFKKSVRRQPSGCAINSSVLPNSPLTAVGALPNSLPSHEDVLCISSPVPAVSGAAAPLCPSAERVHCEPLGQPRIPPAPGEGSQLWRSPHKLLRLPPPPPHPMFQNNCFQKHFPIHLSSTGFIYSLLKLLPNYREMRCDRTKHLNS